MKSFFAVPAPLREAIELRFQNTSTSSNREPAYHDSPSDDVVPGEDAGLLDEEKDNESNGHPIAPRPKPKQGFFANGKGKVIAIFSVGLVLILFASAFTYREKILRPFKPPPHREPVIGPLPSERVKSHFLRVVASQYHTHMDACKSALTSAILNYPAPSILLLDSDTMEDQPVDRTTSKIGTVKRFLQDLVWDAKGDDVVVVLESPNTWFQLRPDVLLQRYYDIQHAAEEELHREYDDVVIQREGLKNSILFSAQPSCPPELSGSEGCEVIEETRSDASYGSDFGLRYINSAVHIGTVNDMTTLYELLDKIAEDVDPTPTNISAMVTQLFGEQETRRASIRKSMRLHPTNTTDVPLPSLPGIDHGYYLDYRTELTYDHSSVPLQANTSASFVIHHNPQAPRLASDVATSTPPFWTLSGGDPEIPSDTTWSDVPLLVHPITGSVPALIQSAPDDWWTRLWSLRAPRSLFTAASHIPSMQLALAVDGSGVEHQFWARHIEKPGWVSHEREVRRWEWECNNQEIWDEVFQDDKGEWFKPDQYW